MRLNLLVLASLAAAGCGGSAADADRDASFGGDVAAVSDAAAVPTDVPPQRPCALGGTGRLRVGVALAPALEPRAPEVWLAARCGDGARELRLVRWDRSPSMVLDGFGPGDYEVFASSFVAAPTTSARVTIDSVSTASLSVTLPAEPAAIASIAAGGAGPSADAGVTASRDATVGAADAASSPSWSARTYVTDPTTGASLASVEVEASPAPPDDDAGADPRVAVRVVVRGTCAPNAGAACPPIALHGAEVRALDGETPRGIGASPFVASRVGPGETTALQRPIVLRGALPDVRRSLRVAIYGAVATAAASGMRR